MASIQTYGLGMGSSIVIFSLIMRSIFSPFIVLGQVTAKKNLLLTPEMNIYKEEIMAANKAGNKEKIMQLNKYMKELRHKYKIKNVYHLVPLLQIGPIIYFFWTLQELAYHVDVYPAMLTDGFLWFQNLSEPDPYFILPVLSAVSTFITIHKSPNSGQASGPAGVYMRYMKYIVFLGIPITSTFPAAIVLNWFIMSFFQLSLNSIFLTDRGLKLLGLPTYLPGSILERHNNAVKAPVIKPKVLQHKPKLPKNN